VDVHSMDLKQRWSIRRSRARMREPQSAGHDASR